MKNVIKFFSIMLVAGSILASCTKKPEEPVTPQKPKYTITVTSNDATMGTVTGGGTYEEGTNVTIAAIPNTDYRFVKWQDGVTEASRSIIVSKDETYTATFEADAPADGINVTFGSDQWTSSYFGIPYYSTLGVIDIIAYQIQTSYFPHIDIIATSETGTHTETAGEQGFMSGETFYGVDYYAETSLYSVNQTTGDTSYYGDWWAKTATINTTNFDATGLTITTVVNATMFDALDALVNHVGIENAATKTMTVTVGNCSLSAAKGNFVPKAKATKLAAK